MRPPPPFRGLSPYTESDDDAELFFGREAEIQIASANLLAARLTLLYGPSGVGKTSLLRAGLVHRLRRAAADEHETGRRRQAIVLINEWRIDPLGELARLARRETGTDPGPAPDRMPTCVADAVAPLVASGYGELLLVLDQFDEYLTSHPHGGPLDEALPALLSVDGLPARMLVSLREDALAGLDRFKGLIPGLFDNVLRLDHLDRDAALEAIRRPIDRFNAQTDRRMEPDAGLAEEVVDQLTAGDVSLVRRGAPADRRHDGRRVEPVYLQLVMTRLWDAEDGAGSGRLRQSTLARLGGAGWIVQTHLRSTMDALDPGEQRLAYRILHLLVTPSGAKIRHTPADLAAYVEAPEPDVARLLECLAEPDRRVLRAAPGPRDSGASAAYEIFHDVLAGAILDWRTDYQARERRRFERRTRRLRAALIAVSAAAVALALFLLDPAPLQRLELGTVDARFAVRGAREPDPDMLLVAVDGPTLRRLDREGAGRLPRGQYARLLRRVDADGPRLIALDVLFKTAGEPGSDRALMSAIRAMRDRLVLPFDNDFALGPGPGQETAVAAPLLGRLRSSAQTGVRLGYAGLPEDVDDANRRADHVVMTELGGDGLETFAFAAADLARGGALRERLNAGTLPAEERRATGEQSERTTWIDYRGPPGSLRQVSALDVLRGRVPRGGFRDKLVVVGVTVNPDDMQSTPLDGGRARAGAEIQANAIATMFRGASLRDSPTLVNVLLIIALACVPGLAAVSRSRRTVVASAIVAMMVFLVAAQLVFQSGRIVAVVAPLLACAIAVVALTGTTVVGPVRSWAANRRSFAR